MFRVKSNSQVYKSVIILETDNLWIGVKILKKTRKAKGRLFVGRLIVWSFLSNLVRQVVFTRSHDDVTNRDVTISVQLLVKGSSSIKTQNWILIESHPVPISIKSSRPTLRKLNQCSSTGLYRWPWYIFVADRGWLRLKSTLGILIFDPILLVLESVRPQFPSNSFRAYVR